MEEEKEFLIQIEDAQDVQSVKGNDKSRSHLDNYKYDAKICVK